MFKLVVLSALLAVAAARPSLVESPVVYSAPTVAVQETSLAHVGNIVKSVPSAISHHSNSVVHRTAHTFEDVLAPAVKSSSYTTKTLATPVVESYAIAAAPTAVETVAAAPFVETYAAAVAPPVVHNYNAAARVLHASYAAPVLNAFYAAPLTTYAAVAPSTYTANGAW